MLTGPAVRRGHHPGAGRAGRARSSTGTASGAARPRRCADGRYLGHRHRRRTSRRRRARGSRGSRATPILGDEVTHVSVEDDGSVAIVTRQQPHGQGHETTLAQVAVDELGVRFEDVQVVFGDTDVTPIALVGTGGSRAATMANGVGAPRVAAAARAGCCRSPADVLEANAADLEIGGGVISVRGTPSVAALAGRAGPDRRARSRSDSPRVPTPSWR